MQDKYLIDEAKLRQILIELDRIKQDNKNENIDLLARMMVQQVRQ